MAHIIGPEHVESVARVLLGSIDVGDGGTSEQRGVLAAFVQGYWGRTDLDPDALDPASPELAASLVTGDAERRRTRELMVLLELCRHPLDDAQVSRTERYAAALGEHGPGLEIARVLVRDGAAMAAADYTRRSHDAFPGISEITLLGRYDHDLTEPAPELVALLRSFADLPEGTLGRAYFEFLDGHGFQFPGETTTAPAVFVAHDMCHVLCGYGISGQEEISVNAMQVALSDTDAHWIQLLGSLAIHEAGFFDNGFVPKTATLDRDGAARMVADAFRRGAECTGDYTKADHLALAVEPLDAVRARFGIPPRVY